MCFKKFAIFGNPISHSQSPLIHALFSEQTGIPHPYGAILAPKDRFEMSLEAFIRTGGTGANITAPFKIRAFRAAAQLSERAALSGAVNTIKALPGGGFLGDNTDGIGLLTDLQRQQLIWPEDHILLVGAGGAARAAILSLLSFGCQLTITNRTFSRAKKLAELFQQFGKISAQSISHLNQKKSFDLVINATTAAIGGAKLILSNNLVDRKSRYYDMCYCRKLTPFLTWAQDQGVRQYSDGLGMLVEQAAHAFLLWHGVMPDTETVLRGLRSDFTV